MAAKSEGPLLDVLKEAWKGGELREQTSIVSHVLKMRKKMDAISELVHDNMTRAQQQQKTSLQGKVHSFQVRRCCFSCQLQTMACLQSGKGLMRS